MIKYIWVVGIMVLVGLVIVVRKSDPKDGRAWLFLKDLLIPLGTPLVGILVQQ